MNSTRSQLPKLIFAVALVCALTALSVFFRRPPATVTSPPQEIRRHDLVRNDGHWYQLGHTNPFTGWMVDFYPDGKPLSRCQISNGLPNGLSETWYTNGQRQVRESFKDGVSDGLREKWYENGSRQSQATIVRGRIVGTFQSWYDNGQVSERIEMKHGQPDGTAWAYYRSGFVKAITKVQEGKVLDRKTWEDGQERQTSAAATVSLDSTPN